MLAVKPGHRARRRQALKKNHISIVPDVVTKNFLPDSQGDMPPRIAKYMATHPIPSPCLVVDVGVVENNYLEMARALPLAKVFYAVKANPSKQILTQLAQLGSNFDVASIGEIDLCLQLGISPARLSFGNTIKKQTDIVYAYSRGIRLFAFDSDAELEKLTISAPGAKVFCRILVESEGAEWPLSRKFGCVPEMAIGLLVKAKELGLDPYGVSFHVGSQQTNLAQWDKAIGQVANLFSSTTAFGIDLRMINLGGGFPSRYRANVYPLIDYAQTVMQAMVSHFGVALPEMIIEPGRSLVGDAGIIQAEVVLVSQKDDNDDKRWVYLDIGKFNGLAETMDESIKYRFITPHDGTPTGPAIIAGPTCDSADILYEKTIYHMPLALKAGDKIQILSTGAYTTTYSAVGFNGFAPLESICI